VHWIKENKMLKQVERVIIVCDRCGQTYPDPSMGDEYETEFPWHYNSEDDAREAMELAEEEDDWRIEGEKIFCPKCAEKKGRGKEKVECKKCTHQKTYEICGQLHQISCRQTGQCPLDKYEEKEKA
jgi:hypothetical protein